VATAGRLSRWLCGWAVAVVAVVENSSSEREAHQTHISNGEEKRHKK